MNQGWECPKCGSVYAPHVVKCFTCSNNDGYNWPKYPWQSPISFTATTTTTPTDPKYIVNRPTYSSNNVDDVNKKLDDIMKKYSPYL